MLVGDLTFSSEPSEFVLWAISTVELFRDILFTEPLERSGYKEGMSSAGLGLFFLGFSSKLGVRAGLNEGSSSSKVLLLFLVPTCCAGVPTIL